MSAFLACHQCYCAGSSLAWGLNLWAVVCDIFWSSSPGVFSRYSDFLPSIIGLMVQPIKYSSDKCDFNSVTLNSSAVPSYQVAHNMTLACDKRSMCCTWFAHGCAMATWAYVQFAALWGDCKISNSAFECDYYYYYDDSNSTAKYLCKYLPSPTSLLCTDFSITTEMGIQLDNNTINACCLPLFAKISPQGRGWVFAGSLPRTATQTASFA